MARFVSLLRGINVGKSNRLRTAELIQAYESLSFTNVQVFIQSGNIVFSTKTASESILRDQIRSRLVKRYSLDVPIIVLTAKNFEEMVSSNPFKKESAADPTKVLVGFMDQTLSEIAKIDSARFLPNRFVIEDRVLYLFCPNGIGKAKLPDFEKITGVRITFRNIRVCEKILEIATDS